jgi:23S rRNA (guanosine2251-2'-O)-methyltransferase
MVQQKGKKPRRNKTSSGHVANWLWGQQSVCEMLEAKRWQTYELYVTNDFFLRHKDFLKDIKREGIEVEIALPDRLEELSSSGQHGGIIARVSKYPYVAEEIFIDALRVDLERASDSKLKPLIVVIDRVQDNFHFASILRSCGMAAVSGVIVGEYCQARITPQISRLCAGAVNHFPIVQSTSLFETVRRVKELGLRLFACGDKPTQSVVDATLELPLALLIGSDAHGLDEGLVQICDQHISIPFFGKTVSMDSVVAASILLFEIRRHQC